VIWDERRALGKGGCGPPLHPPSPLNGGGAACGFAAGTVPSPGAGPGGSPPVLCSADCRYGDS